MATRDHNDNSAAVCEFCKDTADAQHPCSACGVGMKGSNAGRAGCEIHGRRFTEMLRAADAAAIMEKIKTAEFHPDQLGEEFEELLHSLAHKCHDAGLGESTRHFDIDEVAPDQAEHLRMHIAEMLNKARA